MDAAVVSGARPPCRARRDGGPVSKGQRLIKILFVVLLLVLLFGGGAKMIVAGGAKSLNMEHRLLGQGAGERLLVAHQAVGRVTRQSLDIWVTEISTEERQRVVWGKRGAVTD